VTRLFSCLRWALLASVVLAVFTLPAQAARGPYRAASPEYGLSTFLYNQPATTARDLSRVQELGFAWTVPIVEPWL
jgi:hypothetical protein